MSRKGGNRVSPGQQAEPLDVQVNRILKGTSGKEQSRRRHILPVSSHDLTQMDELVAIEDVQRALFEADERGDDVDRELTEFDPLSSQRDALSDGLRTTGEFRFIDPDNLDPEDGEVSEDELALPETGMSVFCLRHGDDESVDDPISPETLAFLRSVDEVYMPQQKLSA